MVKLIKFNIERYKSILNSGDCIVEDKITVLAGKNESGKTNILEGLDKLNEGSNFKEKEKTLGEKNSPKITAYFELGDSEITEILEEFEEETGFTLSSEQKKGLPNQKDFIVSVGEEGRAVEGNLKESLDKILSKNIEKIKEQVIELQKIYGEKEHPVIITVNFEENDLYEEIKRFLKIAEENKGVLGDEKKLESLKQFNLDILKSEDYIYDILIEYIPEIIFFNDFSEEKIPDEIPLEEAKKSQFVRDLNKISGGKLDIDEVIEKQGEGFWVQNFQGQFSAKISEVEIKVRIADGKIEFFVKNPRDTKEFNPSQRSKGFQWFLSFYTRVCANINNEESKIILIDEPGLFLHAKAQKSVLNVLNTLFEKDQIIYSTHSPYLIEEDKLERIRLVEKEEGGYSKVLGKFYDSKDQDTLTPILTAIGHDVFAGITFENNKKCLIVEGISDYLILKKMLNELKPGFLSNHHIIPMKGADSICKYVPFFVGWELDFKVILDVDTKGEKIKKDLKKLWLIGGDKIVSISEVKGDSIEDLFTHKEYFKELLGRNSFEEDKKISGQINNGHKIIASKNLQKIDMVKISQKTKKKFLKLIEKIEESYT